MLTSGNYGILVKIPWPLDEEEKIPIRRSRIALEVGGEKERRDFASSPPSFAYKFSPLSHFTNFCLKHHFSEKFRAFRPLEIPTNPLSVLQRPKFSPALPPHRHSLLIGKFFELASLGSLKFNRFEGSEQDFLFKKNVWRFYIVLVRRSVWV